MVNLYRFDGRFLFDARALAFDDRGLFRLDITQPAGPREKVGYDGIISVD